MVGRETKAADEVAKRAWQAHARSPSPQPRAHGRFLELPVALVLAVMWVVGAALLGGGTLVAWWAVRTLVGVLAGPI